MWSIQIWQAVLIDLWHFIWPVRKTIPLQLPATAPAATSAALLPASVIPATKPATAVAATHVPVQISSTLDECYVIVPYAGVSISPYQGFDTTLTTVAFGEAVTVRVYQNEYAQIMTAAGPGWILKDVVTPNRSQVWPNLIADTVYLAESVVTKLIRLHLADAFTAEALQLPLQSVEYVSYRLKQVNRKINWGITRPRVPGVWQQQLKGRPGIHIGVQPLADSIMECRTASGEGVLYYVESVAPDNTLTCSTVGQTVAGQYSSHIFPVDMWREWSPVFIDVTA